MKYSVILILFLLLGCKEVNINETSNQKCCLTYSLVLGLDSVVFKTSQKINLIKTDSQAIIDTFYGNQYLYKYGDTLNDISVMIKNRSTRNSAYFYFNNISVSGSDWLDDASWLVASVPRITKDYLQHTNYYINRKNNSIEKKSFYYMESRLLEFKVEIKLSEPTYIYLSKSEERLFNMCDSISDIYVTQWNGVDIQKYSFE